MKQRSHSHALGLALTLALDIVACGENPPAPDPGTSTGGSGGRPGTGGRSGTGGSGGSGSGGSASGGNAGTASGGSSGSGGTTIDASSSDADGGTADGAGDGGPSKSLIEDPLAPLPMNLKDTGVFLNFPDTTQIHAKALYFEPRFPLYSNGLSKHRVLVLPEGKKVDTSKRDEWQFPVGTLFFKTFFDQTNTKRPIETRLIRRVADAGTRKMQWEFNVYEWAEDGKSASLLNIRESKDRMVNVGGAAPITHSIPSRINCQECHLANFAPVIGFDELRLNGPLPGQTKTQLDELGAKGVLSAAPTAPFADIAAADAKTKWVLQYMHANCGHCHNGGMTEESITRVFDLRAPKFLASTINKKTEGRTKSGIRIVPGKPDESILFEAFAREISDPELNRMPRVGVNVADKDAVAKLRDWIMTLPPNFVAPQ
jgi:hypothetical protein